MIESIFQTLLLLAYFDIALLSITIANYAVSASYLGRESRLSRWRMERRKKKLLEKLKELRETTQIESIKKEIGEAEVEQRVLGRRILFLSWLGAVVIPSMLFVISFVFSIFGLNAEILSQDLATQEFLERQLIIFSSGTLAIGFMVLLLVIRTIDSAARRLPLPEFDVSFENHEKTIKLKRDQVVTIVVRVHNSGEDVADTAELYMMFPLAFEVTAVGEQQVSITDAKHEYPNCNCLFRRIGTIHIGVTFKTGVNLKTPHEKGKYEIPIRMNETKIGESTDKLVIIVD